MPNQHYQYINLQYLKENTLNDVSIQKEIMLLFLKIIDEYLHALREELPNQNWNELYNATHKIKPNITMFGIDSLEPIILKLENDFKTEQNLDTVNNLTTNCVTIFKNVIVEIETELKLMRYDQEENCFS